MKQFDLLTFMMAIFIGSAIIFAGCTKEGPQGLPGEDGEDGIDGEDGTAGCIECHDDSQTIFAAENQWAASVHATGGNFERNGTSCAPCHTSQGFLEVIETGAMETEATISNPNPQNCYTCHNIHETYTTEDWNFTTSAPVEFWINGDVYDMGKSNVCAGCHQPRVPDPMPVPGEGGTVSIGSPYWGPHHGPQSAMLVGTGGYEVGSGYDNSAHTNTLENGCVTCHMADPYGYQAGGHTMGITYEYYGYDVVNKAGCTACHSDPDALDTKIESTKEDIDGKLAELRSKLLERGVLDSSDHVVPGEMSMDEAGGVFNYLYVLEDRSGGSHNFYYAYTLLNNSFESLN